MCVCKSRSCATICGRQALNNPSNCTHANVIQPEESCAGERREGGRVRGKEMESEEVRRKKRSRRRRRRNRKRKGRRGRTRMRMRSMSMSMRSMRR